MAGPRVVIDFAKIEATFERAIRRAGDNSASYVEDRAKHHAPVRKLFRGTSYRTSTAGFREPRIRQVRFRDVEGTRTSGHANSLTPLFRTRTRGGGRAVLAGDFRVVDRRTRTLKAVKADLFLGVRGGKAETHRTEEISAEDVRVNGGKALTRRGRYEVRSGRADFKAPGSRTTRVGGRLRGEIHVEGPVDENGTLWWYVVSATKDPETGRLYPKDQEFGTRRHKPHPFLRPGLHDGRETFRRNVRREIREVARKR
ncbi:MAG TPA: hypothetical protein VFX15_02905 [Actinomycetes bacterium]|nr:hypothetical protein [Actinomycetes bacterium]